MKKSIKNFVTMVNDDGEVAIVFKSNMGERLIDLDVERGENSLSLIYGKNRHPIELTPKQFESLERTKIIYLATMKQDLSFDKVVKAEIRNS